MSDLQKRRNRKINVKPLKADQPEKDWHWSYTLMLVGLFIGGGATLVLFSFTQITWTLLARIYLLIALGVLLVPFKVYNKALGLEKLEFIMGSMMGIGPLMLAVILGVNMLFSAPSSINSYRIERKEMLQNGWSSKNLMINLERNQYEEYRKFRLFSTIDNPEVLTARKVNYTVSDGLLGLEVVWNIEFN